MKTNDRSMHFSIGKLGLDQFDWRVLQEDALVLNYGEFKYDRDNWRKGMEWHEMFGSTMRHIIKWWLGEDNDPESGLPHLAHARINLLILRNWQLDNKGVDDRLDMESWLEGDIDKRLTETVEKAKKFKKSVDHNS
jgi:hypothetical protein